MTLITDDMKTEWFPWNLPPARPGVYERQNLSTGMIYYGKWNGFRWMQGCLYASDAACATIPAVSKPWSWRGLKAPHDGQTS